MSLLKLTIISALLPLLLIMLNIFVRNGWKLPQSAAADFMLGLIAFDLVTLADAQSFVGFVSYDLFRHDFHAVQAFLLAFSLVMWTLILRFAEARLYTRYDRRSGTYKGFHAIVVVMACWFMTLGLALTHGRSLHLWRLATIEFLGLMGIIFAAQVPAFVILVVVVPRLFPRLVAPGINSLDGELGTLNEPVAADGSDHESGRDRVAGTQGKDSSPAITSMNPARIGESMRRLTASHVDFASPLRIGPVTVAEFSHESKFTPQHSAFDPVELVCGPVEGDSVAYTERSATSGEKPTITIAAPKKSEVP